MWIKIQLLRIINYKVITQNSEWLLFNANSAIFGYIMGRISLINTQWTIIAGGKLYILLRVFKRFSDKDFGFWDKDSGYSNDRSLCEQLCIYMIDSDRRQVYNRRSLLKSASTDVIISNDGPILRYSQIGVLSKLLYL
jgi:hypothetical protein